MDPKATIKAMGVCAVALFIGLALFGGGNSSKPVEPKASRATTTLPSDPCGWQRPSSMTREECERMNAVLTDLWLERERERNPNFKPYSAVH